MTISIAQFKKILPALRLIAAPGDKKTTERTIDIRRVADDGEYLVITAQDGVTDLEVKALDVDTSNYHACVDFTKFNMLIGMLKVMPSFDYEPGKEHNGADALVLQSGKRTIKLDSSNSGRMDYGERKYESIGEGIQWNVSRLIEGLEYISPAISDDETRFHLNGMLLATNGDFVATDGHRLHVYSYHQLDSDPDQFFAAQDTILARQHVKMLQAAIRACGGAKASVYCSRGAQGDARHLRFVVDGGGLSFKITCKLIESRFPPYNNVIPKSHKVRAAVNTMAFTSATKLLTKMSDHRDNPIEFMLNGQLHLRGGGVSESLEAPYSGESFPYGQIGANGAYLTDVSNLPGPDFTIEFGGALDPIVITQPGGFLGVVMPLRVG